MEHPPAQPAAPTQPRTAVLLLLTLAVAFLGLFAAGVLSLGHLLDLPIPCGPSAGCATVAAHPASKFLGIPIAYFGVGAWLTLLALIVCRAPGWMLLCFSGLGTLISGGLLAYSKIVIQATCPWCVTSGLSMTTVFVLALLLWRRNSGPLPPLHFSWSWGLGLVTAIGLGAQAGQMQRTALAPPVPARLLADLTAADLVDPAKSLGSEQAAVTVVMFADLWCPACRATYAKLVAYQRAQPEQVRLVFRHLPLWQIRGHEFSGTAAALSEMAGEQEKFWTFVELIHLQRAPLQKEGYLTLMERLGFDRAEIEERFENPDDPAIARVQEDMALAERLGVSATPTFLVLVKGHPPVSANQRTLPLILNSPVVLQRLLKSAAQKAAQAAKADTDS